MSFREKHLWVSIVATVAVWGAYYFRLGVWIADGGLTRPGFAWDVGLMFGLGLVVLVAAEVVLTTLIELTRRKGERDVQTAKARMASFQASHIALMALVAMIVVLAAGAYFTGLAAQAFGDGVLPAVLEANALVLIGNILMGCVIVAELIRFGFTLALIRR